MQWPVVLFSRLQRHIILIALLPLLTGCIDVSDFGETWESGAQNPCVDEIVRHHFLENPDSFSTIHDVARIWRLGEYRFLMLKDVPANAGGSIFRFEVKDGQFTTYRLNEEKRKEFLAQYPDSGVILNEETVTIPLLNEKMTKLVYAIAQRPDYWVAVEHLPYNPGELKGCEADSDN